MSADFTTARPSRGPLAGLAWAAVAAQILLFGAPLLLVLWLSMQGAPDADLTLAPTAWLSVLGSPEARMALLNSLLLAGLTVLATLLLATPLAYLIGIRGKFLGRLTLAFVIMMWFFDPGMRILGWMQAFKYLALVDFVPVGLLAGFPSELIASLHAWLPMTILCLAFGFARTDRAILATARECGATTFVLLRRILWPLNRRLVFFTVAIVFCGSIGNFLEPRLLGSGDLQQATEWLQRALESETGWPYAAVMLLQMFGLAILPLLVMLLVRRKQGGAA
jgi:ABC-type spermidine/putrescine transport system permease subunit I